MPDTDHDQRHKRDGAVDAEHVDQNLRHGLADGGADGVGEVLDGEEECKEDEEAEYSGDADGCDDAHWGTPGSVCGLFAEMSACVETGECWIEIQYHYTLVIL